MNDLDQARKKRGVLARLKDSKPGHNVPVLNEDVARESDADCKECGGISSRGTIRINVRDPIPPVLACAAREIALGMPPAEALSALAIWLIDRDHQLSKSRARALAIAVEAIRETVDSRAADAIVKEIKRKLMVEGQAA